MLDEIRDKIESEIANLTQELNVELPQRIKTAMEHGDLRENAEFKAAKERQAFVEARLNHLTVHNTIVHNFNRVLYRYCRYKSFRSFQSFGATIK